MKFAAGFGLSVIALVVVRWSIPTTSGGTALFSNFPDMLVLISDPAGLFLAIVAFIAPLGANFKLIFDFLKSCIGWKSDAQQIELGRDELLHARGKLSLEHERLKLERDKLQLERDKFEWERTQRSLSSQARAITYDLVGAIEPEVIAFGERPADQSDVPDLSNGQAQQSVGYPRNQET